MVSKETEKILKQKDLTIEIQLMWNVKTKVIPVIRGRMEPPQNHSDSTSATYRKARHQGTIPVTLCTAQILRGVMM